MIQEDFADMHNHACEALTAAWKLLWSLIIAMFHYLYLGSIWMRNLVEPDAPPAWVQLSFYEPVKLKYESVPFVSNEAWLNFAGMQELREELILCDQENYA